MTAGTVAIVGASVGGVRTAQALRSAGYPGRIVLIGAEADLPYDKPPLSKQFLAGTWQRDRITLLTAQAAAAAGIELRLGVAAARLDVSGPAVVLADDSRIDCDVVVVATGAAARPAPWPGVPVLRSVVDSEALRAALADEGPLVVVGGGFIGAEVAGTARAAGRAVTVVDPLATPIGRLLGAEVGELIGAVHGRHGVRTRFGTGVRQVTGGAGAFEVTLTDGTVLPAATVVAGIGATPNVGWLADSGLTLDNGVLCDRFCRAVGHPRIYAVGDVANWLHPGHGEQIRVEHWTNAVEQAACVAHNIALPDAPRAYQPVEYVWSDQYDWKIQIVGCPQRAEAHEVIGGPPRFAALYRGPDGTVSGAATVNWPKALVTARRLVAAKAPYAEGLAMIASLAPAPVRAR